MTYYVATLVRYVLVEAEDEAKAREKGAVELEKLYVELRERHPNIQLEIRTVRPATADEIESCRWNEETLAREGLRSPNAAWPLRRPRGPRVGASHQLYILLRPREERNSRRSGGPKRVGMASGNQTLQ